MDTSFIHQQQQQSKIGRLSNCSAWQGCMGRKLIQINMSSWWNCEHYTHLYCHNRQSWEISTWFIGPHRKTTTGSTFVLWIASRQHSISWNFRTYICMEGGLPGQLGQLSQLSLKLITSFVQNNGKWNTRAAIFKLSLRLCLIIAQCCCHTCQTWIAREISDLRHTGQGCQIS